MLPWSLEWSFHGLLDNIAYKMFSAKKEKIEKWRKKRKEERKNKWKVERKDRRNK